MTQKNGRGAARPRGDGGRGGVRTVELTGYPKSLGRGDLACRLLYTLCYRTEFIQGGESGRGDKIRRADSEASPREGWGIRRGSWSRIAKPARQVTRELRSHLSQSRYPQSKQGVPKGYGGRKRRRERSKGEGGSERGEPLGGG